MMVRNRLTLAVLLGSPALVTTMTAVLFRPGAFAPQGPEALGPVQIVFWIAFAGFFFGLTYGLLQIVGEMAVFRRERFAGLSVGGMCCRRWRCSRPCSPWSPRRCSACYGSPIACPPSAGRRMRRCS
jgi:hypothetical protein